MTRRQIFFGAMIALLLSVTAGTPRALAQDPNRLTQLKISVWPEYDTPTVLVLLDSTLTDATNLPREVSVLIPASAKLQVTTWTNPDGSYAPEQPSTSTTLGDGYTRVTFTTKTSQYHVEYYDDVLRGAPDKSMDFALKPAAPADQVVVEFQQPLKATNFAVTPATQTTRNDAQGFKYFVSQLADVTAGQAITFQVKYTKSDPSPSIIGLPTPPPSTTTAPTTAAPTSASSNTLFILVALVVLGLTAVIGFFLLQQRSREPLLARSAPHAKSKHRAPRAQQGGSATAFCTQCGHGLGPEDLFCPRCGTKRRTV